MKKTRDGAANKLRPMVRTVFVPQFSWAMPDDENFFMDLGDGFGTATQAEAEDWLQKRVHHFYAHSIKRPQCVRTGIAKTRILRRTIREEILSEKIVSPNNERSVAPASGA